MNTRDQLSNKSQKPRAKSVIYCPSCPQVCVSLKSFIHHALSRHGRRYHSTPHGDNYEIAI